METLTLPDRPGATTRGPSPARAGGATGLAGLYHREYAPMVRLATMLTGSEEVAEELVQDAFVEVHRRWDRIEGDAGGYLNRSVVNACRSWHRKRGVRLRLWPVAAAHPEAEEAIPEPHDDLMQALDRLTYRRRAAIVLRYLEDRDDDEIAEVLGCATSTVRSLVHRGLTQLREVLDR